MVAVTLSDRFVSDVKRYLALEIRELLHKGAFRTSGFRDAEDEMAYDIATLVNPGIITIDTSSLWFSIENGGDVAGLEMYLFDPRDPHSKKLSSRIKEENHERVMYNSDGFDELTKKGIKKIPAWHEKEGNYFSELMTLYLQYLVRVEKRNVCHIYVAYTPVTGAFVPPEGTISLRATGSAMDNRIGRNSPQSLEYLMVDRCDNINSGIEINHLRNLISYVASETGTDGTIKLPKNSIVVDLNDSNNLDGLFLPPS